MTVSFYRLRSLSKLDFTAFSISKITKRARGGSGFLLDGGCFSGEVDAGTKDRGENMKSGEFVSALQVDDEAALRFTLC